jgi:hypothetical protein
VLSDILETKQSASGSSSSSLYQGSSSPFFQSLTRGTTTQLNGAKGLLGGIGGRMKGIFSSTSPSTSSSGSLSSSVDGIPPSTSFSSSFEASRAGTGERDSNDYHQPAGPQR